MPSVYQLVFYKEREPIIYLWWGVCSHDDGGWEVVKSAFSRWRSRKADDINSSSSQNLKAEDTCSSSKLVKPREEIFPYSVKKSHWFFFVLCFSCSKDVIINFWALFLSEQKPELSTNIFCLFLFLSVKTTNSRCFLRVLTTFSASAMDMLSN